MALCRAVRRTLIGVLGCQEQYRGWEGVVFDRFGRCATRYLVDKAIDTRETWKVKSLWPAVRALRVVEEILELMTPTLGMRLQAGILSNPREVGLFKWRTPNMVYVKVKDVAHPFDIVSTTLHEAAHAKIYSIDHTSRSDICPELGHCEAWETYAKMLTQAFAVSITNILYCSILTFVVNLQTS